jgi:hypothetical protein
MTRDLSIWIFKTHVFTFEVLLQSSGTEFLPFKESNFGTQHNVKGWRKPLVATRPTPVSTGETLRRRIVSDPRRILVLSLEPP